MTPLMNLLVWIKTSHQKNKNHLLDGVGLFWSHWDRVLLCLPVITPTISL